MAEVTQRIPEDQHQPWKPLRGIKRGSLVRVRGAMTATVEDLTWDPREGHWWADVVLHDHAGQALSVSLRECDLIDAEPPTSPDVWPAA
jgi:hypothetical protein